MNQSRRVFLKGTLTGSLFAVAVGAGLLRPRAVLAAWPKAAFEAESIDEAMKALTGMDSVPASPEVMIKAPDIAENGSVVPITVSTEMPQLESISVLVKANARPLCVTFNMTESMEGFASTRVKMGKTSDVIAIVKAGGQVYSATKPVKVTLGGCGG